MTTRIDRARRIAGRFAGQRILVLGDLMLDRYIYGSVSRISPEAPVPVVLVRDERNMPGGAANVARNIRTLGARAMLCGLVGCDDAGSGLLKALSGCGVNTSAVIRAKGVLTTVKTRIMAERQQVVRVDWDARPSISANTLSELCDRAVRQVRRCTGVIIEDYGKGLVNQAIVDAVLSEARHRGVPVGLDPKDNIHLRFDGITVATPNRKEAFALAHMAESPPAADPMKDKPLLQMAGALIESWTPDFLMVTLGAQGMLLACRDGRPVHVPTRAREVFDVSGAGDTVIATAVLALASGAGYFEAAELANCAAGVVVGKIGTAGCSAAELMEFFDSIIRDRGARKSLVFKAAPAARRAPRTSKSRGRP
ncbi:MAG: carbohydrate kinase [Lentisphaerae bacterium]|nr:carbohydrate kinase [Lentisphaerota bacterium]